MNDLVENALQQSVNNTRLLLANKADLKMQLDEVESYLTLDINEKALTSIYDQIKAKEADLVEAQVKYNGLQQERSSINSTVITKSAEYSRDIEIFLQKLELHDDSERMMKYSNIALRILEAYAVELEYVKDVNVITKENMVLLLQEKSENRICCKCQYKNAQKVEQLKSL